MEQRTAAWRRARLGKATSSRIADIVARTKSGYSTSRANYAAQLVCERLTGEPAAQFQNASMQWGLWKEPEARRFYEFERDVEVVETGFIDHPRLAMSGASPDGLVGEDGLIEIKCPITALHVDAVLGQSVPGRYVTQMQWQMAVTGRAWCDFVSYDPRLPAPLQLFIQRVRRDEPRIEALERDVRSFLTEVEALVADLQARSAALWATDGHDGDDDLARLLAASLRTLSAA